MSRGTRHMLLTAKHDPTSQAAANAPDSASPARPVGSQQVRPPDCSRASKRATRRRSPPATEQSHETPRKHWDIRGQRRASGSPSRELPAQRVPRGSRLPSRAPVAIPNFWQCAERHGCEAIFETVTLSTMGTRGQVTREQDGPRYFPFVRIPLAAIDEGAVKRHRARVKRAQDQSSIVNWLGDGKRALEDRFAGRERINRKRKWTISADPLGARVIEQEIDLRIIGKVPNPPSRAGNKGCQSNRTK